MGKRTFDLQSAQTVTEGLLNGLEYFHGDEPAIPYVWHPGSSQLVVVVGENSGGKSFFRRLVQLACHRCEVECMAISMEGRSTSVPWNAFIYGSEQWEATGANSAHTVTAGIKTCQCRSKPHVIFWDEPDLGLSESWAAGAGQAICEFTKDKPEHTRAAFVVTHSKALARQLLPAQPHYLYLGSTDGPPTFEAWVEHQPEPRPLDLLAEASYKRFKAIQAILDGAKA
jgi:hypothetical protein